VRLGAARLGPALGRAPERSPLDAVRRVDDALAGERLGLDGRLGSTLEGAAARWLVRPAVLGLPAERGSGASFATRSPRVGGTARAAPRGSSVGTARSLRRSGGLSGVARSESFPPSDGSPSVRRGGVERRHEPSASRSPPREGPAAASGWLCCRRVGVPRVVGWGRAGGVAAGGLDRRVGAACGVGARVPDGAAWSVVRRPGVARVVVPLPAAGLEAPVARRVGATPVRAGDEAEPALAVVTDRRRGPTGLGASP
jgi:hypothetical protein